MKTTPAQLEQSWRIAVGRVPLRAGSSPRYAQTPKGRDSFYWSDFLGAWAWRRGSIQQRKIRHARAGRIARSRTLAEGNSRRACSHRWRDRHAEGPQEVQTFR